MPNCTLPYWHPARIIATVFYVGHLPKAPGTWGSLAAFPLAYFIFISAFYTVYPSPPITLPFNLHSPRLAIEICFTVYALLVILLGWIMTRLYLRYSDSKDPKEVVIDEVAGMFTAFLGCIPIYEKDNQIQILLLIFLFFRLFDIWKPWLVGWADKKHGATGVMLDDIIAGIFAIPCVYATVFLINAIA